MDVSNIPHSNNPHCDMSVCTEYDYDILNTLRENECWRGKVNIYTAQLGSRNSVVDLIRGIAELHSYRRATVHLAVYMLDLFMSHHSIMKERLNLVALTCFYVACKIEENEPDVPSPKKLCSFVANSYEPGDFIALEVVVLNFFNWHVTIPTAATFLDYFTIHSLQKDDFITASEFESGNISFTELKNEIIQSSLEYLDVTLMYTKMGNVRPSLLAAACLAAARCLTPNVRAWNNHLASITGYNYQQIHSLCSVLVFELRPLSASPSSVSSSRKHSRTDSGYLSESETCDDSDDASSSDEGNSLSSNTSSSTNNCVESNSRRRYSSSSSSSSESCGTCAKRRRGTTFIQEISEGSSALPDSYEPQFGTRSKKDCIGLRTNDS